MAYRRFVPICIALFSLACGNDDAAAESTGDATTSGATTTGATGTTTGSETSDGSGSGSTGGSASTTGATDVTLYGLVDDRVSATPIPDAVISIDGMPEFSAVSDADGQYQIEGVPPNTELFVIVEPSADYFGSVVPMMSGDPGLQEQELAQISFAFVDNWKSTIEMMGSQTLDNSKASVLARVIQNTATGTTIDFMPPPVMDTYFAPDSNGNPVINSNVAEFSLLPVVVFANLEPAATGTYAVSASHPERECTVPHPSFPTFGTHVTLVDVDCPPPMP